MIVRIAANVVAAVDEQTARIALAGEAFGEDAAGKSGSDDQVIPGRAQ
jgi:hypothetical protein